jgi:hypothetical protein
MASQGDKSTGKDEGEVKSTPSIIKPRGRTTKLYIFIFYTVLFPF